MEIDDRLTLSTPEGVDLTFTLAGVGSRFVSAAVDVLIQIALIVAITAGAGVLSAAGAGWGGAIVAILSFLVVVGYDVFFEVLQSGRTPGKRINGLRVVQAGGEPITFVPSAIRNVLRIVDFLPAAYLAGIVTILATRRNQRIGDLVAGTIVVRERFASDPAAVATRATTFRAPEGVVLDTSALSAEEIAAVRAYLARRFEIDPASRARIAETLVARLRPKIGGVPAELPGERLLEAIAARGDQAVDRPPR